ncbi:patatin-like phospholipase family protein [Spiribacter curvatus]|nr:patatin-like phospholipase family protein [Spiribacter curvatus]
MGARAMGLNAPLALALQGGGSHGAFTWGVLDCLLSAGVRPAGLSGSSAGALNAAALAAGWAADGEKGARESLRTLWEGIGQINARLQPPWRSDGSFQGQTLRAVTQMVSPYQFNPAGFNPLRRLLGECLDWEALRAEDQMPLFIAATEVATGRLRLFQRHELSVDALLASTCIPTLFQSVEIDGRFYWDGGFAANPALLPLIDTASSSDLMLVQLLPEYTPGMPPRRVESVLQRSRELGFSAHLLRELRWLAVMQSDSGWLGRWSMSRLRRRVARLRFHHLDGGAAVTRQSGASPLNTDSVSLDVLHDAGQAAARHWLEVHAGSVGRRSSRALSDFGA